VYSLTFVVYLSHTFSSFSRPGAKFTFAYRLAGLKVSNLTKCKFEGPTGHIAHFICVSRGVCRAVAQVARRWFITAGTRVDYRLTSCQMSGGRSGTGVGLHVIITPPLLHTHPRGVHSPDQAAQHNILDLISEFQL
jgi:hypothetical protein